MKLRAYIRILVTATVMLSLAAACSKVERVQDTELNEIAMSPLAPTMSKVGGVQDSYRQDESMGVFAYLSDLSAGVPWASDASISSYFESKEFAYDANKEAWVGRTPAYWPTSGSLIFAGYSPYNKVGGAQVQNTNFDVETKTLSIAGYQVETYVPMTEAAMYDGSSQYKNSCQSDLMYFLPKTDAYQEYVGSTKGSVYNANFYHALAQVVFTVQAESTDDVDYIRLRQIVLTNVASKGDFSAEVGRTQEGDVTWILSDGAIREDMQVLYNPSTYGGMKLSAQQRKVVELLTIPIGEHDIKITYSLIVNGKPHEETAVFQGQWEAGKKYTYNIILGIDTIQLVPQITTDWVTNE